MLTHFKLFSEVRVRTIAIQLLVLDIPASVFVLDMQHQPCHTVKQCSLHGPTWKVLLSGPHGFHCSAVQSLLNLLICPFERQHDLTTDYVYLVICMH